MIKQENIDEIKRRILDGRTAAGYYATIAKVIEKWSGKVYNKRMSDDLQAATDGAVFCKKEDNTLYIHYRKTKGSWYPYITFSTSFDKLENKRINSDVLLPELRERRENLLKEAQKLETALENLDTFIEQVETLKKTCKALFKDVPYEILDAIGESRYTLRY